MSPRKRILITGASRGIGKAIALTLASTGYDLILWARSKDALDKVAAECSKHGALVEIESVDVGDAAAVSSAALRTIPAEHGLDGVVLNAGEGTWRPLLEETGDTWRKTINTNLNGAFYVLRESMTHLKSNSGAQIVAISSDSVLYPFPDRAAYSAAKSGMHALLETARLELREAGIRVSVIFPSRVDTSFKGRHANAKPGTRPGALRADDIANVVGFLFSLPSTVEIREIQMASLKSTFGPFSARQEI